MIEENWALCDYCPTKVHKVTQEWIDHHSYAKGDPNRIAVKCDQCRMVQWTGGKLVKGYGAISMEEVSQVQDQQKEEIRRSRRTKVTQQELSNTINWQSIDTLIGQGNCKVKQLADDMNANPVDLRNLITEHYGDRIEFRRGRAGGVYWRTN